MATIVAIEESRLLIIDAQDLARLLDIQDRLRKEVYKNGVGSDGMGAEQAQTIRDVFLQYDNDRSGGMDWKELRKTIRYNLYIPVDVISDRELMSVFKAVDEDESGIVETSEFVDFLQVG